jgi:hypothetical protein
MVKLATGGGLGRLLVAGALASATAAFCPEAAAQAAVSADNDGSCPDADAAGTCLVGVRHMTGSAAAYVDYAGQSASLGLGYLQTSWRRASYDATQRADWHAYGLLGRAFLGGANEKARGWGAMATGRLGVARRVGAMLELSGGLARGDGRTLAVASAGVFATIFYVDLGYSFQTPLGSERPDWLGTHLLSIRAQLPFLSFGTSEWRSSDGWFPGS